MPYRSLRESQDLDRNESRRFLATHLHGGGGGGGGGDRVQGSYWGEHIVHKIV